MTKKQKKKLHRILVALGIFAVAEVLKVAGVFDALPYGLAVEFAVFLVPYLVAGHDVLARAWHGIRHKQPFDENLLMAIATLGAFALVFFPETEPHMAEGAAVMLFYQVGSLFESYAVGKTRASVAELMDIAPDYANVMREGELVQVDPAEVAPGTEIVCKPGERVPLDGVVVSGVSQVDTSAITGESAPRTVEEGTPITSGFLNMTGVLRIRTTSTFEQSSVQRILELVENASEKKARTENFITRFARVYTPAVVGCALVIALACPLAGFSWGKSVESALVFLVVSCPCALVISVPLSFFGGIGAASRAGILVKGSNYLEALANVDVVAFDKTGTLTTGNFGVVAVHARERQMLDSGQPALSEETTQSRRSSAADAGTDTGVGVGPVDDEAEEAPASKLLFFAAHAEAFSDHPLARCVVESYGGEIERSIVSEVEEHGGHGVSALVSGHRVLVGNGKLMAGEGVAFGDCERAGTVLHVALDGDYLGHLVVADLVKDDAARAIADLHAVGVKKTVMLSGDREQAARAAADALDISEVRAQLLPQDKVRVVEELIAAEHDQRAGHGKGKVAFVGDGINDAPVLMRADVGIAMGALGSDAAIEAADVVLMDDKPSNIARAVRIGRKTIRIVKQNIAFALAVKIAIMVLALPMIGISNMWMAVFGDVGVSVLAILNAMRCLSE